MSAFDLGYISPILPLVYPVFHPVELRDFVMFSFMTCDCHLVWLGLAFESATLGRFSEKQ